MPRQLGGRIRKGIDVEELDIYGRLHRVVMFFGPLPISATDG